MEVDFSRQSAEHSDHRPCKRRLIAFGAYHHGRSDYVGSISAELRQRTGGSTSACHQAVHGIRFSGNDFSILAWLDELITKSLMIPFCMVVLDIFTAGVLQ